jgi:hypothetical protein
MQSQQTEESMNTNRGLTTRLALAIAVTGFLLAGVREASAAGSGIVTAPSAGSASGTSTVTLKIPGLIGIDVESDVNFDLTTLSPAATPGACTNVFPAGSACANATYSPTSVTTTAGATPAPAANAIFISIIDTTAASVATKNVKNSISATWGGTTPGIATTDVQTQKAGSNNGGLGNAAYAALPTAATAMTGGGTIPNGAFNWTRQDQLFQLVIGGAETPSATAGATATVTYTFSRT